MSYSYETERPFVFTDEGQRMLLRVRDFSRRILREAGAVRADKLLGACDSGDSWSMMACVDRLCELGYLKLIPGSSDGAWQYGIYINGKADDDE